MAITEAYMDAGDFSVSLRIETRHLMETVTRGGWLVVTNQHLGDPRGFTDSSLLGAARYSGIVLETIWQDGVLTLNGAGQDWIWGNLDSVGWPAQTWSFTSDTLATVLDLDTGTGITPRAFSVGTVASTGTYTGSHTSAETRKKVLTEVMASENGHYRLNPDGSIDASLIGTNTTFLADPEVVFVREDWGSDALWTGVPILSLHSRVTMREWTSNVDPTLYGLGGSSSINRTDKNTARTPENDLLGGVAEIHQIQTPYTQLEGANVGDTVYLYDPGNGFVGSASDIIWFRGQALQPVAHRIHEATWPIVDGMGVYYRPNGVTVSTEDWIDLTSTVKVSAAHTASTYVRTMDVDRSGGG